jgi:hypothetical protein
MRKEIDREASAVWGLSRTAATAPIQAISTALRSEGPAPAIHMNSVARTEPPKPARRGPTRGLSAATATTASTERCSPDRARMCEQPAALKASASPGPRLSRTPRMSASSRPAETVPIRARADLQAARAAVLARSSALPGSRASMPRGFANRTSPAPPEPGEPRARTNAPASRAGPPAARRRMEGRVLGAGKESSASTPSPASPTRPAATL